MITVTPEEILQYRSKLADCTGALEALDLIEQYEGDLVKAVKILAIRDGDEQSRTSDLLNELLAKSRRIICQEEFRQDFAAGVIGVLIEPLATKAAISPLLATAITIYAFKIGMRQFCQLPDSDP